MFIETGSPKAAQVLMEVIIELAAAEHAYPPMRNGHEGFAILNEEVDELWDYVKLKQSDPTRTAKMRREAIQVAAMALRFVLEVCDGA